TAVTRPPGDRRQPLVPSSSSTRSTGNRLATITRSAGTPPTLVGPGSPWLPAAAGGSPDPSQEWFLHQCPGPGSAPSVVVMENTAPQTRPTGAAHAWATTAVRSGWWPRVVGATPYSLLALPMGVVAFVVAVTGVATGVPLVIVWVGLPVLAGTLLVA